MESPGGGGGGGGGGGVSLLALAEDGECVVQLSGKDLIYHSDVASPELRGVQFVRGKENLQGSMKHLKFSRYCQGNVSDRRVLCSSESRISVWQLNPLQLYADIEGIESGTLNIDFGSDENEVIVFHPWNTKLAIHSLDSGRSQVIKSPKFSHPNGFGYRSKTRQLAILLKPEASDLLTIHEFQSYELINRAVLPTVDAQGLKWSPDGTWIAVWETASAGTKVVIYTADGQLYRTYTGPPGEDSTFDLGVKAIEWAPADSRTGSSELLAVAKVDGNIDILTSGTFSCSVSLSHVYRLDQNFPAIWRENATAADGTLNYIESSGSAAFSAIGEPTAPPRGVSTLTFSPDGRLLASVDQQRPNIVWLWSFEIAPRLVTAFVHDSPVRQAAWHPWKPELLITTANSALPVVRHWIPGSDPAIIHVPVKRNDTGRYDVRWLASHEHKQSTFWVGSSDELVLGHLSTEGDIRSFHSIYTVMGKSQAGSSIASVNR
ncbi:hypothetical protein ASPZODRAFT_520397 [Penicilliopsis zonata CBS 506.65]|uniref:Dipeptidylpeptidase IV N-terminal domain-containing protein n=1 Tax=Penicilliopsis zonata CBS 506.65 TaxID=1073090 RepID=A0A1L9SEQ7_9EURO|nr:hypothetical protein ASPZODRAFT_520397 [Penicilliopsis zonata CBS 506.65]OJJ45745.1 hypothetical protein ASPZODRAFT_520397 [Penicilliopsis zonata CBS 506.65]